MVDKVDEAQAFLQYQTDIQISNIRKTVKTTTPSLFECENCGAEIPLKRRIAVPGASLCVECQRIAEIKNKHVSTDF